VLQGDEELPRRCPHDIQIKSGVTSEFLERHAKAHIKRLEN
jgi:hypothetical protein